MYGTLNSCCCSKYENMKRVKKARKKTKNSNNSNLLLSDFDRLVWVLWQSNYLTHWLDCPENNVLSTISWDWTWPPQNIYLLDRIAYYHSNEDQIKMQWRVLGPTGHWRLCQVEMVYYENLEEIIIKKMTIDIKEKSYWMR